MEHPLRSGADFRMSFRVISIHVVSSDYLVVLHVVVAVHHHDPVSIPSSHTPHFLSPPLETA